MGKENKSFPHFPVVRKVISVIKADIRYSTRGSLLALSSGTRKRVEFLEFYKGSSHGPKQRLFLLQNAAL